MIIPPRCNAVPSNTAATAPSQRDRHLQDISERGRMRWRKTLGYHWRALVEADMSRFKRVIGDAPRSRTDRRREYNSERPHSALRNLTLEEFARAASPMVRSGAITDYGELARLGHISPARLTQIMAVRRQVRSKSPPRARRGWEQGRCCEGNQIA